MQEVRKVARYTEDEHHRSQKYESISEICTEYPNHKLLMERKVVLLAQQSPQLPNGTLGLVLKNGNIG